MECTVYKLDKDNISKLTENLEITSNKLVLCISTEQYHEIVSLMDLG